MFGKGGNLDILAQRNMFNIMTSDNSMALVSPGIFHQSNCIKLTDEGNELSDCAAAQPQMKRRLMGG